MQDFMIRDVLEGVTVALTVIFVAYSPVMRALGNRIMHGRTLPPGTPVADPRVDELLDDNAMLRRQLDEMQERVAFAERMLAQSRTGSALPGER